MAAGLLASVTSGAPSAQQADKRTDISSSTPDAAGALDEKALTRREHTEAASEIGSRTPKGDAAFEAAAEADAPAVLPRNRRRQTRGGSDAGGRGGASDCGPDRVDAHATAPDDLPIVCILRRGGRGRGGRGGQRGGKRLARRDDSAGGVLQFCDEL
ncbi:hypothetical protein NW759_016511 [Fusarium solani]|nr:hypothetical protein NW759_016511 [Fusarium solani]